jgi:type II secretory pathway predicted ATPase ExeA
VSDDRRRWPWQKHNPAGQRKSQLTRAVKTTIEELVLLKKQQVLLCIDEANLLRYDVLEELHTLNQFALDSKNMMSIVLCGQNNLIDKQQARTSAPLASRVVARHYLQPLKAGSSEEYINHHMQVAKAKHSGFE